MASSSHAQMKTAVTFATIGDLCATPQIELEAQPPAVCVHGHVVSTLELLGDHAGCPLAFAFAFGLPRTFCVGLLWIAPPRLPSSI